MLANTVTALTATAALGALIAVAAPTTSADAASRHFNGHHGVRTNRVHAKGRARINHGVYIAKWKARSKAISHWRSKVSYRYGSRFSKWFMARGKVVNCNTRRFRVSCHVSARPKPIGGYGFYRGHNAKPRVITHSRSHRRVITHSRAKPRFVAHSRKRDRARNQRRRHNF